MCSTCQYTEQWRFERLFFYRKLYSRRGAYAFAYFGFICVLHTEKRCRCFGYLILIQLPGYLLFARRGCIGSDNCEPYLIGSRYFVAMIFPCFNWNSTSTVIRGN